MGVMLVRGLIFVVAIGIIAGGVLLITRRSAGSQQVARISPDDIAPALALRTLAGEPDAIVVDQALEENQLETAFATLYFSTDLPDSQRAAYWIALGQSFAEAKQKERARTCYGQASSVLLLSSAPFDNEKASALLTLGKDLAVIGDAAEAERTFDFAYTIARYSPYVPEPQRRFILSNLASEYKALGNDKKSDESTRALSSLPASVAAGASPADAALPEAPLGDEVKAATAWRMRAAQRLINSLGSTSSSQIDAARRNLEDALRAEDDLRSLVLDNKLGQAPSTEVKAALAKERARWLTMRYRVAQKGFGVSLAPAWERSLAEIKNTLRQSVANYFMLRREAAVSLPDAVDAAQARVDLLRQEMMAGKIGLYPDYPENRLIAELSQGTKERIDLREEGLYVAVLSQEGRGQLVITTADLWGRPAAMASAGLGMSFPTMRPPAYAYPAPTTAIPTIVPTRTPAVALASPTRGTSIGSTSPSVPPTATPQISATPAPTQPTSPVALGTSTRTSALPTTLPAPSPTTRTSVANTPLPTPVPIPTATFTHQATATPGYNYQVIYSSGPLQRQDTGNDNFHIVGMVVDQNGVLISGLHHRLSWCCPAGQAVHPRPTIDVDNGRFDFAIGRGQFTLDIVDGDATTEPVLVNTDVSGLTGYVEWEYTFQRTNRGIAANVTRTTTPTATPTATGTARPPTPTPPLPGAVSTRVTLDPGWNFIALPLSPVNAYTGASLQGEINAQINTQGGGVAEVAAWDGSGIRTYSGNIAMGVGYLVNITGTNRVYWQMTGYPLVAPVPLNLNQTQKTSVAFPFMAGGAKTADQVRQQLDAIYGTGTFVRMYRMRDGTGFWEYYDGTAVGIGSFQLANDRGYLLEVARTVVWAPWQAATATPTQTSTPTPTVTATASPTPFDTYEPNDTFDLATQMTMDTARVSYISHPYDRDFYQFTVTGPQTIYLSMSNLPDDYDLYLYNPSRQEIDASFNGGQTTEYITRTVTAPGVYFALVQGAGPAYDTIKPYKLLLASSPQ